MPGTTRLYRAPGGSLLHRRAQADDGPAGQFRQDKCSIHLASLRAPLLFSVVLDLIIPTHRIEQRLLSMPPVRALQLRLHHYDGERLHLAAPLAPNINDKANAFGGSLASAMTLAAWALVSVKLEEAGLEADVYVQDSMLRYRHPLYDELTAEAWLAPEQSWEQFLTSFRQRGKARAQMLARICNAAGTECCSLEGRFVALAPRED